MNHGLKCSALIMALLLAQNATADRRIEMQDVGFATPESAEYYAAEDLILVTNINGHPAEKDRNGFISKVSPEGKVIELKWLDGEKDGVMLNAPKGMTIIGNRLFVTDIDSVRIFQLPEGGMVKSIQVRGSSFLNGITPMQDGSVLVTDTGVNADFSPAGNDAVYQVWPDGYYKKLIDMSGFGGPNGVLADANGITVVTFGSGDIYQYSLSGELKSGPVALAPGLDGLVGLKDGQRLITGWGESTLYQMSAAGEVQPLVTGLDAPADIDLDTKRNRVLVPLFKQDRLLMIPLE